MDKLPVRRFKTIVKDAVAISENARQFVTGSQRRPIWNKCSVVSLGYNWPLLILNDIRFSLLGPKVQSLKHSHHYKDFTDLKIA